MTNRPTRIPGRWRDGYALDFHTVSSEYVGDDEFGHPRFDTRRSELGELLFQLKYRTDTSTIEPIVDAVAAFVEAWQLPFDVIVPVPPSRTRPIQPVLALAAAIGARLQRPCLMDAVVRVREVPALKDVFEFDERTRLLDGTHSVDRAKVSGIGVLLFDDLFRSGATMNSITAALYDQGHAKDVFALTVTRTRRHR